MEEVFKLYVSLLPVILAGIANSIFVKTKLLNGIAIPIDGGKAFIDRRRIFGDSKTYKGFLGYVVLTMLFTVVWGLICANSITLLSLNYFYESHASGIVFNLCLGCLLGIAWALFELPNSFIKRRLNIKSSMNAKGFKGLLIAILDQADSIFGVVLVLALFYPITIRQYFFFVAIGAITHLVFNFLLFVVKIRKRPI
jgi:CDP-diglyceride synthetase